jgi:hypothetical protein
MDFFFVRDIHRKYRYFSSEPNPPIQVEFSRLKKYWESAKTKLLLLPTRVLKEEQAFERTLKIKDKSIVIYCSGRLKETKIKHKFSFYLHKQRTKHIVLLAGESLLLPISGVAAILPGPNIFFYVLALLMIVQWRAVRGINQLRKKEHRFIPSDSLEKWEEALDNEKEDLFLSCWKQIENEHSLQDLQKILGK